jgi:CubicO group peptidase (beta-lactamase class C family)
LAAVAAACSSSSSSPNISPNDDGGGVDAGGVTAKDGGATSTDAAGPFQSVHDELFTGKWTTDGVVIMRDGKIIYEEYANGYTKDTPHITYSVSKSIGGTLVGMAIADGYMKLTESVCTYITKPASADPKLCDTTVEDLLHMSSGLSWAEDYGIDPTTSNVLQMLYGNTDDMGAYAAGLPRAFPTNTKWSYSSGDANILALAFKGALAAQSKDGRTYAQTKLFAPLGITTSTFETDHSGTLVFSSSWYATPRDMGKMGQLYLDDGMVGTTRVLPANWVKYAITPAPAASAVTMRDPKQANPGDTGGSYGAQVWLNAVSATQSADTFQYPGAPGDTYAFEGHYGQKIFVIPSRKVVIARVGNDRKPVFDPSPMIQKAVAVVDALIAGGK